MAHTIKKVLVTGGSGLIGGTLIPILREKGFEVGILSRSATKRAGMRVFTWDTVKMTIDPEAVEWADAVIHLAGAGIADKPWTPERMKELVSSRVDSTKLLLDAMKKRSKPWAAFIGASAIGYYGFHNTDQVHTEEDPPDTGFLAKLCADWEAETKKFEAEGVRTVRIRVGVVLSANGGALPEMARPVKWGAGAPLGSGKQIVSWIHITDMARIFAWALENPDATGVYNGVGPDGPTNRQFTKTLAKVLGRPMILPPVPAFAIRMIAGKGIADLALFGSTISAEKVMKAGFEFQFSNLESALTNLLKG